MHLDSADTPGIVVIVLKRYNAPAVRASSRRPKFQISEPLLRELRASLTRRYRDFDVHPAHLSEAHGRSEQDCEEQIVLMREPQAILQAPNRRFIADVDLVVLQGTEIHRERPRGQ